MSKEELTEPSEGTSEPVEENKAMFINAPPTGENGVLDAIRARAVGGKVAVIERGAKEAKVVEAGEQLSKQSSRQGEEGIPLSESTVSILQGLLSEIKEVDAEIGQNTRFFKNMIDKLNEQANSATESLNMTIRHALKKHQAPEGWKVDLKTMKIVPPQQPPQIIMRHPGKKKS
jgi:hypothetical protein